MPLNVSTCQTGASKASCRQTQKSRKHQPPKPVAGLTATPDQALGKIALRWDEPGEAVSEWHITYNDVSVNRRLAAAPTCTTNTCDVDITGIDVRLAYHTGVRYKNVSWNLWSPWTVVRTAAVAPDSLQPVDNLRTYLIATHATGNWLVVTDRNKSLTLCNGDSIRAGVRAVYEPDGHWDGSDMAGTRWRAAVYSFTNPTATGTDPTLPMSPTPRATAP